MQKRGGGGKKIPKNFRRHLRMAPFLFHQKVHPDMTSVPHFILRFYLAGGGVRAALHPRLQQRPQEDVRHPQAGGQDTALLQRFVRRVQIGSLSLNAEVRLRDNTSVFSLLHSQGGIV